MLLIIRSVCLLPLLRISGVKSLFALTCMPHYLLYVYCQQQNTMTRGFSSGLLCSRFQLTSFLLLRPQHVSAPPRRPSQRPLSPVEDKQESRMAGDGRAMEDLRRFLRFPFCQDDKHPCVMAVSCYVSSERGGQSVAPTCRRHVLTSLERMSLCLPLDFTGIRGLQHKSSSATPT